MLLPSPRASDTNGAGHHGGGGMDLRTAVAEIGGLCDGCDVRGAWEHRCHGEPCPCPECREERRIFGEVTTLLPTPEASRAGGTPEQHLARKEAADGSRRTKVTNLDILAASGALDGTPLLPTPAVNDMGAAYTPEQWDEWTATMKAKHNNGNDHGKSLNVEAQRLLPTPTAQDSAQSGGNPDTTGTHGTTLTDATVRQPARWGEYGPAIRRWEALTRPAPEPTKLNAKGNPKLSDEFDEWLMGFPKGWITDVPGITWNEVLKACGNGVVWQQGAAALRWLLAMGRWAA